ncbi:MAG: 4-demethylwyosine synthase TYW1 [Halobacteriota archaeon]
MRKKKAHRTSSLTYRQLLAQQGYHAIGSAGAVKTCLWLKKALRDEGVCYKEQFYGTCSHRCIQMTPTVHCNQRCLHCWRATDLDTISDYSFDQPETLVEASLHAQQRLTSGYKGYAKINTEKLSQAQHPKQVAISLSGEPTLYPYWDELIALYRRRRMTTFVVSNGSIPTMIERIRPTQLYISLNSPDEAGYYATCKPRAHQFDQLLKSLQVLADHPARTAIRVTLARNVNASAPGSYAQLIEQAEPDYVEIKSYMHLGYSRQRLPRTAMLTYDEVKAFAQQIADYLGYAIASDSQASRVVILSKNGSIKKIAQ